MSRFERPTEVDRQHLYFPSYFLCSALLYDIRTVFIETIGKPSPLYATAFDNQNSN